MELHELHVTRLPGLETPFTVRGVPGVNLVLGPNGSGKSSLCRAALGLLWSDPAPVGVVRAVWRDQQHTWLSSRDGGARVAWQRDGQPAEPPAVPPTSLAGAFRLGILDLLKPGADRTDHDLARQVRNQLAGGYDLAALLAEQGVTGQEGRSQRAALDDAEREVRRLREDRQQLAQEEARLRQLRGRLQAAKEAARRATALAAAQTVVEARTEEAARRDHLERRYPPAMDRLPADAAERLDRLRTRQRSARDDQAAARRELAEAADQLAAANLPDGAPDAAVLAGVRSQLDQARALVGQRHQARERLAAAATACETAREHLAPWGRPEPPAPVDAAALRREADAVRTGLAQLAGRDAMETLLARPELQTTPPGPPAGGTQTGAAPPGSSRDPDRLAATRAALVAWLAAGGERAAVWPVALAAVLLLAAGLWLQPWRQDPRGWFLIGGAAMVAGLALWRRLRRPASARARAAHAAAGGPAPAAWEPEAVAATLAGVLDAEVAAGDAGRRDRLRQALQAEHARLDAETRARSAVTDDPAAALDAAERLHRDAAYHRALVEQAAAAEAAEVVAGELAASLAGAREQLQAWLDDPAPAGPLLEPAPLETALESLASRAQQHRFASQTALQAQQGLERAEAVAAEAGGEATRLLADLDLGPGDDARLQAMAAQLQSWRAAAEAATRATAAREAAEARLAELPEAQRDLAATAVGTDAATLAAERQEAVVAAAGAEELKEEVVRIETRVQAAEHDAALDRALARRDAARGALTDTRDRTADTALRRLLLEHLRREHRRAAEPAVLQRARELFGSFTSGRWHLQLADDLAADGRTDPGTFRAIDTRTGRGHGLAELSDGTRAQLLLAARLAFLQEAERGLRLPLFLDESLTASDAERFAAVAAAVIALVREQGRQVFYLTCDPADVTAWQQALARAGLPAAPVTELQTVRREAAAAPEARLRPFARPLPPPPGPDTDPVAYALAAAVPPLASGTPAAGAHLFHLLRDQLPRLHALITREVTTLGQTEQLLDVLAADGVLPPEAAANLLARGRALEAFLAAFAVGRGRPIPRGAIVTASGVSSGKLEEVDDLAARLDGDAERLLGALADRQVSRFQREKQEELADWLERAGYRDRRAVRDLDEVRVDVTRAVRADLQQGRLTLPELATLVAAWWTAAGGGGSEDRSA